MKKALQILYDQKDHLPWNTGQEKKVLKRPIDLTGINSTNRGLISGGQKSD